MKQIGLLLLLFMLSTLLAGCKETGAPGEWRAKIPAKMYEGSALPPGAEDIDLIVKANGEFRLKTVYDARGRWKMDGDRILLSFDKINDILVTADEPLERLGKKISVKAFQNGAILELAKDGQKLTVISNDPFGILTDFSRR